MSQRLRTLLGLSLLIGASLACSIGGETAPAATAQPAAVPTATGGRTDHRASHPSSSCSADGHAHRLRRGVTDRHGHVDGDTHPNRLSRHPPVKAQASHGDGDQKAGKHRVVDDRL